MQVGDGAHPWTADSMARLGAELVAKASTRLGLLVLEVLTSGEAGKNYAVYVLLFPLKRPVSRTDGQRDLFLWRLGLGLGMGPGANVPTYVYDSFSFPMCQHTGHIGAETAHTRCDSSGSFFPLLLLPVTS